jgi:hypothetical protein
MIYVIRDLPNLARKCQKLPKWEISQNENYRVYNIYSIFRIYNLDDVYDIINQS